MAAITAVFTLAAVAQRLAVSEDLLLDLALAMEPEDGYLTVYGPGEEETAAFTRNGIERLRELIDERQQSDLPLNTP